MLWLGSTPSSMKNLLFLITLLCVSALMAQHPGSGDCNLGSANKTWISKFKKSNTLSDQLNLIYSKMISDSEYLIEHPEITNLDDKRVMGPIPCGTSCTIRFGILYDDKRGLVLDINKNPELEDLILEFTMDNIESIELNELKKRDIYQHVSQKRTGVVLYSNDKELKRRIKKVVKQLQKEQKNAKSGT